jgi:hypothetical protein
MNSLISYTHHLNTINQNVAGISRSMAELNAKQNTQDKKLMELDHLIAKLQSRLGEFEVSQQDLKKSIADIPPLPPPSMAAPKPVVPAPPKQKIVEVVPVVPAPVEDTEEVGIIEENEVIDVTSIDDDDDIVIQEKKPRGRPGRKPKKV